MTTCPHCGVRVVPMADGVCPSCRTTMPSAESGRDTRVQQGPVSKPTIEIVDDLSQSPFIKQWQQVEVPFLAVRDEVCSKLREYVVGDRSLADRIRDELLPQLEGQIAQLGEPTSNNDPQARLVTFAVARVESWRLLAEALHNADREALDEHLQWWDASEFQLRDQSKRPLGFERVTVSMESAEGVTRGPAPKIPRMIATPVIVVANILVFVIMVACGVHFSSPQTEDILNWGANYGPKTLAGEPWRILTCMFIHFGVIHLALNMWILSDLAQLFERVVGSVAFAIVFFIAGIGGSISSLAWNPTAVAAGASGGVFGIAGGLLAFLLARRDRIPPDARNKLLKSLVMCIVINVIIGLSIPAIDQAAHLGGLLAGFLCALVVSHPVFVERMPQRQKRNVAAALVGGLVLLGAFWALPAAPDDFLDEVEQIIATEAAVNETYREMSDMMKERRITPDEYLQMLERDVIAPWKEMRILTDKLVAAGVGNRETISAMAKFYLLREQSLELQLAAGREKDDAKLKKSQQLWQEADKLMHEFLKR